MRRVGLEQRLGMETRTVTLTQIVDSGSGTAPNANTTTLAVAATVNVAAVADAPTLTATGNTVSYTEGTGAAIAPAVTGLFSGASISVIRRFLPGKRKRAKSAGSPGKIQSNFDRSAHCRSVTVKL